ncbi:MAG: trimethylamine methyltransferase family protein [Pseudomonadota bacterium]
MSEAAISGSSQGRRGRSARRNARLATSFDSLPALERGLPYLDLMTPAQLEKMHDATMRILENKGIEFRDDESAELWRAAGATVNGHHIRIPRELLMQLISTVPSSYTMHARNPERTVKLGDGHTCFVPAYGSPMIIDMDGKRRNATLEDFNNFAKLAYMAPAMHMTGGVLVEPMDVPVPKRHLHMMYSLLKYSDKPFMGMVLGRDKAIDSMEMVKLVFGEEFLETHTVMTSLANGNSPLVWDETMLDAAKVYARHNQAMLFSPFALCGASTPASVVGTMAQISAEALAGVAFSQLCRKGAPAVYGQWLATVSMQSGAPMAGTPEICHINMLMGQLARFYKLPMRCSGMCTSSKVVDTQAGYEAGRNMYGVLMSGANFVLSTAGYMEGAMAQSYAKYAIDIEQMELFYRLGKGPDFDGLGGALDAIDDVEIGHHYLGSAHTLENFQTAFSMPNLMDHNSYEQWAAEGGKDANQRGIEKIKKMLGDYQEPALDSAVDDALLEFIARREAEIGDRTL